MTTRILQIDRNTPRTGDALNLVDAEGNRFQLSEEDLAANGFREGPSALKVQELAGELVSQDGMLEEFAYASLHAAEIARVPAHIHPVVDSDIVEARTAELMAVLEARRKK